MCVCVCVCVCVWVGGSVWQVLELVQRLLQEDKMATQREVYYCLVNHFKDQAEFNSTLQGKTVFVL